MRSRAEMQEYQREYYQLSKQVDPEEMKEQWRTSKRKTGKANYRRWKSRRSLEELRQRWRERWARKAEQVEIHWGGKKFRFNSRAEALSKGFHIE